MKIEHSFLFRLHTDKAFQKITCNATLKNHEPDRPKREGPEQCIWLLESLLKQEVAKRKAAEIDLQCVERVDRLRKTIFDGIAVLHRCAEDGDNIAIAALAWVAADATGRTNAICEKHPELVLPLARNIYTWPAMTSRKSEITRGNKTLIKRIELGRGGIYKSGKWQPGALLPASR